GDHVIADAIDKNAKHTVTENASIPADMIGVDIGPKTIQAVTHHITSAKTILWNGPMGVFEVEAFAEGTMAIARALAEATKKGCTTIIGGGDSVSAVKKSGVAGSISHISTGGGASLEFLEGKKLPGIEAISNKK
ncbi:MAG: phosphoglycerate kinase, partial [Elusimicrobia bacterium]|nr:phosphoglycerate kinase [Elusimicrobiota bacterium]MBD3412313.1 phosphoglycerate kinase [Elusimicrobiota bacterium]